MTVEEISKQGLVFRKAYEKYDFETCEKLLTSFEADGWNLVFKAERDNLGTTEKSSKSMSSYGWRVHAYLEKDMKRIWLFRYGFGRKGEALYWENEFRSRYEKRKN